MNRFSCLKLIFTFICFYVFVGAVSAQDVITKTNGDDIYAKIFEVGSNEIRYKRFDNQDGPTFVLNKNEILMIRYENGSKDIFNNNISSRSGYSYVQQSNEPVPSGIVPGMRYKDYSKYYKLSDYKSEPGDKYSPALSGVCSFFIPGLGQIVSGEYGRGAGWLLGYFGLSAVTSAWLVTATGDGAFISGAVVMPIVMFSYNIANIVDAVNVAKKKNMYTRDVRRMTSGVDINLAPYVSTVKLMPGLKKSEPIVGLALNINF